MKKIVVMMFIMLGTLFAGEQPVQKAVFDCASKDLKFITSRMWLVEESAKELKASNTPYEFVVTIHSGCTQIVDKTNDKPQIVGIQKRLKKLVENYGVKIEACGIATRRWDIAKSDMPEYIDIVENSITRVIKLQNSGYAFIPYN